MIPSKKAKISGIAASTASFSSKGDVLRRATFAADPSGAVRKRQGAKTLGTTIGPTLLQVSQHTKWGNSEKMWHLNYVRKQSLGQKYDMIGQRQYTGVCPI